jgi:hypothetical protein
MALGRRYQLPSNNILLEAKPYRALLHQSGNFHCCIERNGNRFILCANHPAQRSTDVSNAIKTSHPDISRQNSTTSTRPSTLPQCRTSQSKKAGYLSQTATSSTPKPPTQPPQRPSRPVWLSSTAFPSTSASTTLSSASSPAEELLSTLSTSADGAKVCSKNATAASQALRLRS